MNAMVQVSYDIHKVLPLELSINAVLNGIILRFDYSYSHVCVQGTPQNKIRKC